MVADRVDVIVIGGGIAGLSAAFHLARARVRVALFEKEPLLASHASGRNAAIFRHLERDAEGARIALRSRELLDELRTDVELVDRTGALYIGSHETLAPLKRIADQTGVAVHSLLGAELLAASPALRGTDAEEGLLVPHDGVIDIHALVGVVSRRARDSGAVLQVGVAVRRVVVEAGATRGVELENGEFVAAERVVIAAGAWAADLGSSGGATLPIEPRRRHLMMLVPPPGVSVGPVVWRVDEQVYFRAESGGVLASPCDETVSRPGVPSTCPEALVRLATRLARTAPALAASSVRTSWACLRSFAPDGGFVVGEDPRARGLVWVAGLGGRGMTCGLALGEIAARRILGEENPLGQGLSPARLLPPRA